MGLRLDDLLKSPIQRPRRFVRRNFARHVEKALVLSRVFERSACLRFAGWHEWSPIWVIWPLNYITQTGGVFKSSRTALFPAFLRIL